MSVLEEEIKNELNIYYTIEYEIEDYYLSDPYLAGNKTVRVYKCIDNKIKKIAVLNLLLQDTSEIEVKEYLESKDYINFKLTQL